jgi:hypothetical protein
MRKEQAAFIADRFLDRFKDGYDIVDENNLPVLQQYLNAAGKQFQLLIKANLDADGSISTGALYDIPFKLAYGDSGQTTLEVGYAEGSKQIKYYDFVNQGVKGVGGKNAKPKPNTGKYKFKNKRAGYFMANRIIKWLANAKFSTKVESTTLSASTKKKRSLSAMSDAAASRRKLSFQIATAIKRDGLRGTGFFDKAFKETFNSDFYNGLALAVVTDLQLTIRTYGNNDNR